MKIRSPGRRSPTDVTGVPAETCWNVVRGREPPAAAQAICTSDEQSHQPDGSDPCGSSHDPPHWYGVPSADSAAATATDPRPPAATAAYLPAASDSIDDAYPAAKAGTPYAASTAPGPAL